MIYLYASRKIRKPAPMPIAELGKEKVFPLGGKNYKYKKLNREKVSALPTKEGRKKTKNKRG